MRSEPIYFDFRTAAKVRTWHAECQSFFDAMLAAGIVDEDGHLADLPHEEIARRVGLPVEKVAELLESMDDDAWDGPEDEEGMTGILTEEETAMAETILAKGRRPRVTP